jgi:hypothetical protein
MLNFANPKDVKKAVKAARVAQRADDEFLEHIMSTTQGRAWMWKRLGDLGIFQEAFDDNDRREAFMLGRQSAGRAFLADINRVCPALYLQAMIEANERSAANERPDNDAASRDDAPGDSAERPRSESAGRDVEGSGDADYDPYTGPGESGS